MDQIQTLCARAGQYIGKGLNHDSENFIGELFIEPIVEGKGLRLKFKASGDDGLIYHQEETLIAPSEDEGICLWTLNNNIPFIYKHKFREINKVEGAETTLAFFYNNPEDLNLFREQIAIDLWPNGDITYRYSWGIPGGDYKERSGSRMTKQ